MGYSEEIDGLCRRRGYYDRGTREDYRRMLESADIYSTKGGRNAAERGTHNDK